MIYLLILYLPLKWNIFNIMIDNLSINESRTFDLLKFNIIICNIFNSLIAYKFFFNRNLFIIFFLNIVCYCFCKWNFLHVLFRNHFCNSLFIRNILNSWLSCLWKKYLELMELGEEELQLLGFCKGHMVGMACKEHKDFQLTWIHVLN